MKFMLEIEITDEMKTGATVIKSLRDSLKHEEKLLLEPGVGGLLWAQSGETVGKWIVIDDKPNPADVPPANLDAAPCDECGALIPDNEPSGVNSSHYAECSLYEAPKCGRCGSPFVDGDDLEQERCRACLNSPPKNHSTDSDCTVDPHTLLCVYCGVMHGEPCPTCGGKGFHDADCPDSDANRDCYRLDAGRVITLRGKAVCCINWVPGILPEFQYPMTPVDMDDLAK
jgi:hypothetical protein